MILGLNKRQNIQTGIQQAYSAAGTAIGECKLTVVCRNPTLNT